MNIGAAMTAAMREQRDRDIQARWQTMPEDDAEWWGPTSRTCTFFAHNACTGEYTLFTATAPCLCPCHATNENQRRNLEVIVEAQRSGSADWFGQ